MRLRLALHYTGQMFLRLGLATVIVVGNTLIMKEQITLFSYLLFLSAASRLYDPLSGAMVNMAELFAVDLQVKRLKGIQDFSVVFQNVVLFNNTIMEKYPCRPEKCNGQGSYRCCESRTVSRIH